MSSCLENLVINYQKLSLARFLEIRVSVFFGKKRWIFKTLRKIFESILKVWRGLRTSEKEGKKKSGQKTDKKKKKKKKKKRQKWDYFFAAFQLFSPFTVLCSVKFWCRVTRPDVGSAKMAQNWQKMPKKAYIVIHTDSGQRKRKSADFWPDISWFLPEVRCFLSILAKKLAKMGSERGKMPINLTLYFSTKACKP